MFATVGAVSYIIFLTYLYYIVYMLQGNFDFRVSILTLGQD